MHDTDNILLIHIYNIHLGVCVRGRGGYLSLTLSHLTASKLLMYFPHLRSWVVYEEPNYRGRMYVVERGNYSTHKEWQAENPNIQSVRRVANYF